MRQLHLHSYISSSVAAAGCHCTMLLVLRVAVAAFAAAAADSLHQRAMLRAALSRLRLHIRYISTVLPAASRAS
jgi:hypothetical protein